MTSTGPVLRIRNEYELQDLIDTVSAIAPDAPDYATARELVLRHLSAMLP